MIVVVIIGILAAIAIPIFANQQKSALVAGVKSDVKNTNTNIVTYLTKNPTASNLSGNWLAGSAAIQDASSSLYKIVRSDNNTRIAVRGAWNTYYIDGFNDSIGAYGLDATSGTAYTTSWAASGSGPEFRLTYNSMSGKLTQAGG
jgi:type IV pilus assembly protein PilA